MPETKLEKISRALKSAENVELAHEAKLADKTSDGVSSDTDYWTQQTNGLKRARAGHDKWMSSPKRASIKARKNTYSKISKSWKRETFCLPLIKAQEKARAYLKKFPKAAYWSEVESWRELPDDVIEFTMRRLPTAD